MSRHSGPSEPMVSNNFDLAAKKPFALSDMSIEGVPLRAKNLLKASTVSCDESEFTSSR